MSHLMPMMDLTSKACMKYINCSSSFHVLLHFSFNCWSIFITLMGRLQWFCTSLWQLILLWYDDHLLRTAHLIVIWSPADDSTSDMITCWWHHILLWYDDHMLRTANLIVIWWSHAEVSTSYCNMMIRNWGQLILWLNVITCLGPFSLNWDSVSMQEIKLQSISFQNL